MTATIDISVSRVIKPDFLIIGAQKCGTTWLWEMLKQHPDTDLRISKETFFFSSSENYRKGLDWYYQQFNHLDRSKVRGEACTDYFYDHVLIDNLSRDDSVPTVPQLVTNALPDVRILLILRDPVQRAISAYYHHMRRRYYSPFVRIKEAAEQHPRLRIVERGLYARFLRSWKEFVPSSRMLCLIFEEDVVESPEETVRDVYDFLGLNVDFRPTDINQSRNRRWGWTHLLLNHYLGAPYNMLYRFASKTPICWLLDSIDFLDPPGILEADIKYLRSIYLPEKEELEDLLGRDLECWTYNWPNTR